MRSDREILEAAGLVKPLPKPEPAPVKKPDPTSSLSQLTMEELRDAARDLRFLEPRTVWVQPNGEMWDDTGAKIRGIEYVHVREDVWSTYDGVDLGAPGKSSYYRVQYTHGQTFETPSITITYRADPL